MDLLKVVLSLLACCFSGTLMAPDLISFLAISLASLASMGRLLGVFCSVSGLGVRSCCRDLRCKHTIHCY